MVKYNVFYNENKDTATVIKETINLEGKSRTKILKNISKENAKKYEKGALDSLSFFEKLAFKFDSSWTDDFFERYQGVLLADKVSNILYFSNIWDKHYGLIEFIEEIQNNIDYCLEKTNQKTLVEISEAFSNLRKNFEKQIEVSIPVLDKFEIDRTIINQKLAEIEKEKNLYLNSKVIKSDQIKGAEQEISLLVEDVRNMIEDALKPIEEERNSLNEKFINIFKANFKNIDTKTVPEISDSLSKLRELFIEFEYEVFDINDLNKKENKHKNNKSSKGMFRVGDTVIFANKI